MAVTMSYGAYNFSPVPLVNFAREYKKSEDGRILSAVIKVTLDGTLVSIDGSLTNVITLKDALSSAVAQNGCLFTIDCSGSLLSKNTRVLGLSFKNSQNNWINSVGYTLELEYDDSNVSGEISDASNLDSLGEEWQIEPIEDKPYFHWSASGTDDARPYLYKMTHTISAKGRAIYTGCSSGALEPWEYAANYCSGKVGATNNILGVTGAYYNYNRTQAVQKYAGTYNINENWMVFKSDNVTGIPGAALEDFTIDVQQSYENDIITVGVQGNIQGLEVNTYTGVNIITKLTTTDKYSSALSYFNSVSSRFFNRAQQGLTNSTTSTRALNPLKVNKTIGHNIGNGIITYNYGYNNKPSPCVANALSESINFTVDYPQDVIANISVLGRTAGPIIQLMGTRTAYNYSLGIDVTVPIVTGCTIASWALTDSACPHANVKTYLCQMEASLSGSYGQLAKTADHITWNPKEGKYVRNVSWTAVPCAGAGTAVNDLT